MKASASRPILSYLLILPASAVYALGFNWCFAPNDIAFGGLTGCLLYTSDVPTNSLV